MRVLVTDADTPLAQALLPALCDRPGIDAVAGISLKAPRFAHPSFRALQADYRNAGAYALLAGYDALVHLGHIRDDAGSDALDAAVRPVHRFFHAAHEAGIARLIHVSTAAVYGAAIHASEQAPLKPLEGFRYAQEQAHLERLLEIDFPGCVRLRPHLVVGPHAHPAVRRFLRQPFYPRSEESQALFQCLHEDDLAAAVVLCLESDARGAYNLAAEDSFSLRDALRARRWFAFGLAPPTARRVIGIANRAVNLGIDPVWLERTSRTLLVNCRRAIIELNWRCRYRAFEALAKT